MARFKQVSTGLTLVCERKDVIEQYESGNFAVHDTEIAKIVLSEVSDVED